MYVYIYVHICVCVCIYDNMHSEIQKCVWVCTYTYIRMCGSVSACVCVDRDVCMHACIYLPTNLPPYIHTHPHLYIYIYIYCGGIIPLLDTQWTLPIRI